jgi:hypothetical protein
MKQLLRVAPVVALAVMYATSAGAGEPQKLWEVTGLEAPECAELDAKTGTLYVSNKGFLSKISADGKNVELKWATGLNRPQGIALVNGHIFTGDGDEIVEIDMKDGKILAKHKAPGAKMLNDIAADAQGNVYAADTMAGGVYKLSGGKVEKWLDDPRAAGANGLLVEGDNLIVNTWGVLTGKGFETSSDGRMLSVSLADKKVKELDGGKPVGHLDGLKPLGNGEYLISDWMLGKVLKFGADGKTTALIDAGQGSADFAYDASTKTLFLPMMLKNNLAAYKMN